ncbi:MAG TPA: O-antigen ligase family protein [Gaiellaceae bacterium]|nr:O-antigen ligase family protein [Gaiellaceae bacterium]
MIGLARLAAPIACVGLAILLTARTRQNRLAGLGYAAVGTALLVASLRTPGALEVAGAIVGLLVLGPALAWAFRREPWLVAYLALATLPIRVHFLHHQLLVPLYVVAAGAAFKLLRELVAGDERSHELGRATKPLALYLVWIGVSMLWTVDIRTGAIDVLAYYVPLSIIALSVARLPWKPLRLKLLYLELAAMALVFACVGFYQYETRQIFENPKLNVGNSYASLFRVNSVFYDPSIYGRFLVVALLPTAVLIVRGKSLRDGLAALAFAVVAWLGLLVSFSQSSFSALFVAVFCLCAYLWRWKAVAVLVVVVVLLVGGAVAEPKLMHSLGHHGVSELNKLTSGRGSLIYNGLRIAKRHPVYGVGLGGFSKSYSKLTHRHIKASASHNTPVTVVAEGGVIGLALFLWLAIAFGLSAFRRLDRTLAGDVGLAAGLIFVAIFAHANAYNDFFEDPTTWLVFGLIGLSATRRAHASTMTESSAMIEP